MNRVMGAIALACLLSHFDRWSTTAAQTVPRRVKQSRIVGLSMNDVGGVRRPANKDRRSQLPEMELHATFDEE